MFRVQGDRRNNRVTWHIPSLLYTVVRSAVFLKCISYFIRSLLNGTTAVLSKKGEEEEKVKEKREQNTLNGLDGLNMCGSGPFAMYFKYILILPAKPVSFYPLCISHQRLAIAT